MTALGQGCGETDPEREICLQEVPEGNTHGSSVGSSTEQREKLSYNVDATKASADPPGCSDPGCPSRVGVPSVNEVRPLCLPPSFTGQLPQERGGSWTCAKWFSSTEGNFQIRHPWEPGAPNTPSRCGNEHLNPGRGIWVTWQHPLQWPHNLSLKLGLFWKRKGFLFIIEQGK